MTLELGELKRKYEELRSRHGLPAFGEINGHFGIDRIDRDGDLLMKEIRKTMMDKVIEYTRFIEMLINPVNAPPIFLQFSKYISHDERKTLERIYERFVLIELKAIENDVSYNDKNEAKLIGEILDAWKSSVDDLLFVVAFMRRNLESKSEKKEKMYLG